MSQKQRAYDIPHLRKLGFFTIILASLYVVFFATVLNPNLTERDGQMIFMAILGATIFVFLLNFSREKRIWEKSLGK